MISKIWYAAQRNEEDNDYIEGSYDYEEAVKKCIELDYARIAAVSIWVDDNDEPELGKDECIAEYVRGIDF